MLPCPVSSRPWVLRGDARQKSMLVCHVLGLVCHMLGLVCHVLGAANSNFLGELQRKGSGRAKGGRGKGACAGVEKGRREKRVKGEDGKRGE